MANYLKLGEKAESFFDPISRLKITKGKVVKLDSIPKTPKVLKALKNGHIEKTTEDDYSKMMKIAPAVVEAPPAPTFNRTPDAEFLGTMKKEEIIAWAKTFGFDDDDMASLTELKKSDMIDFVLETYPNYDEE
jgi:hypothetical protein